VLNRNFSINSSKNKKYMSGQRLVKSIIHFLGNHFKKQFIDLSKWKSQLKKLGVVNDRRIKIVTEGPLLGSVLHHGLPKGVVIVSDNPGQFNIFTHALCWIHAECSINKLIALSEEKDRILEDVKEKIWDFYKELKVYKSPADETKKTYLEDRFEEIFTHTTDYQMLNLALERIYENKAELVLVLERPEIPLHNNLSETDIREYAKMRKVSGSTRSDEGRRCRDTFASLKKTCPKLGVSFWDYLLDRISRRNEIPLLHELILHHANAP